jgi:hypothetical protein
MAPSRRRRVHGDLISGTDVQLIVTGSRPVFLGQNSPEPDTNWVEAPE